MMKQIILLGLIILAMYPTRTLLVNKKLLSDNNSGNDAPYFSYPIELPKYSPLNIYDLDGITKPRDIAMELRFMIPSILSNNAKLRIAGDYGGTEYIDTSPPTNVSVIKLPYHATNINVTIINAAQKIVNIPRNIHNAPIPSIENTLWDKHISVNSHIVSYKIYSGIDPATLKMVKYVVITTRILQPINDNVGIYTSSLKLRISYALENKAFKTRNTKYDLVIITSKNLSQAAEKLKEMKEKQGMRTIIKYVEDIYSDITLEGRDKQESIRKYLKYAKDRYDISFAIILGDTDVVPARYAYIPDGAYDNNPNIDGAIVETDLYYADLDYTWDDNNDGKWGDLDNDKVDGWPDILVGRIPASNLTEALAYIEKLEKYSPIEPLYSNVLFAGTDTFMVGYPEGEYLLEYSEKFVKNATITKIYETYGNLTRTTFIREMDKGYSFVGFTGHGTHESLVLAFSETYSIGDAFSQKNKILPVFLALSCDAGRFAEADGIGEALVLNPNGGAIAFLGSSRLAWGYIGELVVTGLMGEMFWRTIKSYFNRTLARNLGRIWAKTISEYITKHNIEQVLAGYYIDWKTVAEYNLLGDPTISVYPTSKDVEYSNGLAVENGAYAIENKTIIFNGDILVHNGTLKIINSTIIMNGTNVMVSLSNITINNSIIMYGNLNSQNGSIILTNTSILSKLVLNNSNITINNGVVNEIEALDNNSSIYMYNSTAELIIHNPTVPIENWRNGYIEHINLSEIGYIGEINWSYVGLSIAISSLTTEIINSSLDELDVFNSYITLENVEIGKIFILNSTLNSSNAIFSIQLYINSTSGSITLRSANYTDKDMRIGDSRLILTNTEIEAWIMHLDECDMEIVNSKISEIIVEDSSLSIANTSIIDIVATNLSLETHNVSCLSMKGNLNVNLYRTNITMAKINGEVNMYNSSRIFVIHATDSSININASRIYQLYVTGSSTVLINNSKIVEAVFLAQTHVNIYKSRMALLDCKDTSNISLYDTDVIFWLRIYDKATLSVEKGEVWLGLVFNNTSATIRGFASGKIDEMSLDAYQWKVYIKNATIIGWDIISYSSDIEIEESQIGWIFLYYKSKAIITSSVVRLLRITHNSTATIEWGEIASIYASGYSNTQINRAVINSLYLMGKANVKVLNSSFEIIAGMGSDAEVTIVNSQGGYVAAIENTTFDITNSIATIYLAFYEIDKEFSGFLPKYLEYWDSSEKFDFPTKWKVKIRSSWVSWALDFEQSNVTISNSLVTDLYAMNSRLQAYNVRVSEFFAAFGSNITLRKTNLYGIDFVWRSDLKLVLSAAPTLYVVDSTIRSESSLIGVAFYLEKGSFYARNLKPGYYDVFNMSEYVDTDALISIELVNTSVFGWAIIGLGLSGNLSINVDESELIAVGIAYNASLCIKDTLIYGYTQILTNSASSASVKIEDSKTRIYLYLIDFDNVEVKGFDKIEWNYTGQIIPNVFLENVTIFDFDMDLYMSNATIENSNLGSMEVTMSNVNIMDSYVDNLLSVYSNILIDNSNIGSLTDQSGAIYVWNSQIRKFIPYDSEINIDNSSIGLGIYVSFGHVEIDGMKPSYVKYGVCPTNISIYAYGVLENVEITSWHIVAGYYADITIENSQVGMITIGDIHSALNISNTSVDSVTMEAGKIIVDNSDIGMEFDIHNMELRVQNLTTKVYHNSKTEDFFEGSVYWSISLKNTNITSLNISTSGSIITIDNCELSILIVESSDMAIYSSNIIQLVGMVSNKISLYNSWARLASAGIGSEMYIDESVLGLVVTYIYGDLKPEIDTSSTMDVWNGQMYSRYRIHNSEVYDWTIYAGYVSNITVENQSIFTAYSDGFAKLWLIDTRMEYPIESMDLGEIHVLFTLEIEVRYDFMRPKEANIKIEGEELTIEMNATNGYINILLYQAIVKSYERKDLGTYKITASIGPFSSSKRIYLWRSTRITIYIMGPITIGIIVGLVILAICLILEPTRKKILRFLFRTPTEEVNTKESI